MRYKIEDSRFENLVDDYISEEFSNLKMEKANGVDDMFFWFKEDRTFVVEYIDEGYGFNEDLYNHIMNFFSLSHNDMDYFLKKWISSNMPFPFNEIYTVEMG